MHLNSVNSVSFFFSVETCFPNLFIELIYLSIHVWRAINICVTLGQIEIFTILLHNE